MFKWMLLLLQFPAQCTACALYGAAVLTFHHRLACASLSPSGTVRQYCPLRAQSELTVTLSSATFAPVSKSSHVRGAFAFAVAPSQWRLVPLVDSCSSCNASYPPVSCHADQGKESDVILRSRESRDALQLLSSCTLPPFEVHVAHRSHCPTDRPDARMIPNGNQFAVGVLTPLPLGYPPLSFG